MLEGLKVAVDVQHLWKPPPHDGDRGSLYTLEDGTHVTEAHCTTIYAMSLCAWLTARGASVLTNNPARHVLIGFYSERCRAALHWGAHVYLACHLNAGRGSYASLESMAETPGLNLGIWIGEELRRASSLILSTRTVALKLGERGAPCVQAALPPCAAVIVEPFFGDNPRQQILMTGPGLAQVGEAIATGVGNWWLSILHGGR